MEEKESSICSLAMILKHIKDTQLMDPKAY